MDLLLEKNDSKISKFTTIRKMEMGNVDMAEAFSISAHRSFLVVS